MKRRSGKSLARAARKLVAEYRYTLSRDLRDLLSEVGKLVLWCALNPSTANESEDDPSSRRMMEFTRLHGGNRMLLVNAYAAKATKPNRLRLFEDPIGPENDRRIIRSARVADLIIACWGNPPFKGAATRFEHVTELLRQHGDVYRLAGRGQRPSR